VRGEKWFAVGFEVSLVSIKLILFSHDPLAMSLGDRISPFRPTKAEASSRNGPVPISTV